MKPWLILAAITLALVGIAFYEIMLWNECRGAGHSWWYCLRVVTR